MRGRVFLAPVVGPATASFFLPIPIRSQAPFSWIICRWPRDVFQEQALKASRRVEAIAEGLGKIALSRDAQRSLLLGPSKERLKPSAGLNF